MDAMRLKATKKISIETIIINIYDKIRESLTNIIQSQGGEEDQEGKPSKKDESSSQEEENIINKQLTLDEIDKVLNKLYKTVPELKNIEKIIKNIGLPDRISSIILSSLQNSNDNQLNRKLYKIMDKYAWNEFCKGCELIETQKSIPNGENIFDCSSGWNLITKSILCCPSVQLPRATQRILQFTGGPIVNEFIELWKQSQSERNENIKEKENEINRNKSILNKSKIAHSLLDKICSVHKYEGNTTNDLLGVLYVISGTYSIESKTSLFTDSAYDVTELLNENINSNGVLSLSSITFPTSLLMGTRKLVILYREKPNTNKLKLSDEISQFTKELIQNEIINGSFRSSNGPYTWYKLPEWLQVEITQLFANSMEHTPWYRFPFFKVLFTYFNVFKEEFKIVSSKYGISNALFNSAFITDFVPFLVMGFLFIQMNSLALPLLKMAGDSYDDDSLYEQVIVTAPCSMDWKDYQSFTLNHPKQIDFGIWMVDVRTFKPFTKFLKKLAFSSPSSVIFQISNHSIVQVKLSTNDESKIDLLNDINGCKFKFKFSLPTVGSVTNDIQIALEVQVSCLLDLFRFCADNKMKVVQVYDFFG